jgi:DnaK suppressor protein
MLSNKTLAALRDKLVNRRRELLDFRRNAQASWQSLREPEKELEEMASKETMSRGLEHYDERSQEEIRKIDDALTKMEEGDYGRCEACNRRIAVKRLHAVPWARHCIRCAASREGFSHWTPESSPAAMNTEELTDEEVQEAVYDALREDGRVEMEELNISCEDGVLYLDGVLPSAEKREILLEIVDDVLDFNERIDNIQIDRQPWERPERSAGKTSEEEDQQSAMEVEGEEVDAHTSLSTGEPMTPPNKLTPENRR